MIRLIGKTLFFFHPQGGFQSAKIIKIRTDRKKNITQIHVRRGHGSSRITRLDRHAWEDRPGVCGVLSFGKVRPVPEKFDRGRTTR
jgi:hypothetical protein